jgi:3D-(3,5/4)-trihydroxycyclohexane-1,2-dione acylhydrolase (decyclizing)
MRMTAAEAIVRFLAAQRVVVDDDEVPYFPGVFAIFGHGNALSLGAALEEHRHELPTYRGQNEQGMALAAVAYAKAARRRQCMVVTTSIGPGALNVVTAAGVAMANRLPLLVLSGDTFTSRLPDPVLQQVEHPGSPSTTVNDAFRPVVQFWDRITSPDQLTSVLPALTATLLDPADCGPAFLALPQDVQAMAHDFPEALFRRTIHALPRPRASLESLSVASDLVRLARRPLIVAGGGVHYSLAERELAEFAARHGIPVVETMAGKSSLVADHPAWGGPLGVTGADPANELAAEADVVLAVGTRLQDFTTGSWTVFQHNEVRIVGINASRFDATKHRSLGVVGDARESLLELDALLGDWRADPMWTERGSASGRRVRELAIHRWAPTTDSVATYAQVVGVVHAVAADGDYVLTAAGGLPGEVNNNWLSKSVASFDCEYGFSCMGYEISGAWGAAMQRRVQDPDATVFGLTGDGSYLMLNSDIYSAVLNHDRLVLVVCDNAGFAVIQRLQTGHGGASFRTMLEESPGLPVPRVDFAAHARSMGAHAVKVSGLPELRDHLVSIRDMAGVHVVVIEVQAEAWTEGGAFWEVGVPEVSSRDAVAVVREALLESKKRQRTVW